MLEIERGGVWEKVKTRERRGQTKMRLKRRGNQMLTTKAREYHSTVKADEQRGWMGESPPTSQGKIKGKGEQ